MLFFCFKAVISRCKSPTLWRKSFDYSELIDNLSLRKRLFVYNYWNDRVNWVMTFDWRSLSSESMFISDYFEARVYKDCRYFSYWIDLFVCKFLDKFWLFAYYWSFSISFFKLCIYEVYSLDFYWSFSIVYLLCASYNYFSFLSWDSSSVKFFTYIYYWIRLAFISSFYLFKD
jgi:hypothetical protein